MVRSGTSICNWWESQGEGNNKEYQDVDGLINIKLELVDIERGGVNCTGLAPERDKWRALVSAVMDLRDQ
jgi:hypothetical protein